jgi:hypothetical protein
MAYDYQQLNDLDVIRSAAAPRLEPGRSLRTVHVTWQPSAAPGVMDDGPRCPVAFA